MNAIPTLPQHLCKPRLRRWEAAEYLELAYGLKVAAASLAKMASTGGGPAYHSVNRAPLYPTVELDSWAIKRLGKLVTSTSEVA